LEMENKYPLLQKSWSSGIGKMSVQSVDLIRAGQEKLFPQSELFWQLVYIERTAVNIGHADIGQRRSRLFYYQWGWEDCQRKRGNILWHNTKEKADFIENYIDEKIREKYESVEEKETNP